MQRKCIFLLILAVLVSYCNTGRKTLSAITPPIRTNGDLPYYLSGGFGTKTEGGPGGQVIKVTNLYRSGAGSLKAALDTRSNMDFSPLDKLITP